MTFIPSLIVAAGHAHYSDPAAGPEREERIVRSATLTCLLILAASFSPVDGQENPPEALEKFVVHEWGVQVRSMARVKVAVGMTAHGEGKLMSALIPPMALTDDLPAFVLRHSGNYTPERTQRMWKKPVIHLYGPEGLEVGIEVHTPLGTPWAYWPEPTLIEGSFSFMGSTIRTATGMKWSGKLLREAGAGNGPIKIDEKHWWHTVREVPSRYFQTEGGTERFVFYEGTAVQGPAVTADLSVEVLKLHNTGSAPSSQILVIVNDLSTRRFMVVDPLPANGEAIIKREDMLKAEGDEAKLLGACAAQWQSLGMTEAESQAIVETWKPDLLDRPGMLVISRIPAALYDQMRGRGR